MWWYLVGAFLGLVHLLVVMIEEPVTAGYPNHSFAFALLAGGAVYGTLLWLLVGGFFG